jgi:hypothetical protein
LKKAILSLSVLLIFSVLFLPIALKQPQSKDIPKKPGNTSKPAAQVAKIAAAKASSPVAASGAAVSPSGRVATASSIVKEVKRRDRVVAADGKTYPLRIYKPLILPNDPLVSQWWNASTDIDTAWTIGVGTTPTLLAIIDTGFALQHEEFANRWYKNPGETGITVQQNPSLLNCTSRGLPLDASCNLIDDDEDGIVDNESWLVSQEAPSILNCTARSLPLDKSCNLVDDDGNGLVDDVTGFDFVDFHPNVQAGKINPSGTGTQHGTMTTGVAAATGNNGKGIAGINWSTKILPIQALDDDSYGDTLTVSRSVRYAADQGADVISISLGSSSPDPYLRQAIDYAISKGSIVVAASGNDGCGCISYPADYEEVVAVGALNTSNQRASFSNWGANLDVMAPGVSMASSTWTQANPTSAYASGIAGTSFSTPFVAGLLTLAKSQQPQASPLQLIASLTEQTDRTGVTLPHDNFLGYGRTQAGATMTRVTQSNSPPQTAAFQPVRSGNQLGNFEKIKPFLVYECGSKGTTPIYKLSKGGQNLYTISEVEKSNGVLSQGYGQSLFSYSCLNLPTDTPVNTHMVNILGEFENRANKP